MAEQHHAVFDRGDRVITLAQPGQKIQVTLIGLINNRGNLGATLSDTLSSDSLKGALIAAAYAGVSYGMYSVWGGATDPAMGRIIPHNLSTREARGALPAS